MTVKSFIFIAALLTSNLIPSARCAPFPADQTDPAITVYHNVNVLTKEDLEHGRVETEKMLQALPEMRAWAKSKDSPFYNFAVKQYAGESLGWWLYTKILHEKPSDKDYSPSAYLCPTPRRHGEIQLSKWVECSVKDKAEFYWACFVFESFNMRNSPFEMQLFNDAALGKINKEQFIRRRSESEIEPGKSTAKYFFRVVKPWARAHKVSVNGKYWDVGAPQTVKDWWSLYKNRNEYPWSHYGKSYDNLMEQMK